MIYHLDLPAYTHKATENIELQESFHLLRHLAFSTFFNLAFRSLLSHCRNFHLLGLEDLMLKPHMETST